MKIRLIILILSSLNLVAYAQEPGQETYKMACQNCHAPDLAKAIKAPAAFDKSAWNTRFQQASLEAKKDPAQYKSAIDYLLHSVRLGKGLMHHGGLCHEADAGGENCSKEDLINAIHYMSKQ